MNVKELKNLLQSFIDYLEEEHQDTEKVTLYSNTYFMGHPYYFLGIAGNNGGYINLDNPIKEEEGEEYEKN